MILTLRLALLLAVFASVAALAQQAPLTIQGRVSAADTGAALPRARVTILIDGHPEPPTYTDDRGDFAILTPSRPAFTLSVVKAGYAAMQIPLQREAFAAAPARGLGIALTRSAAVNGRVVDNNGETIVGQRVYADRLDPEPGTPVALVKFSMTTDDRGEYRLGGLPPGRYSVTTVGAQDPGAVATLDLRPGDEQSGINFTALPPRESAMESSPQPRETPERAAIRGRVVTTTGRAIAQAVVNITGPMPPRNFVTDAQGRFAFTGLNPGDYEVRATRGDFLPTPTGPQTTFQSSSRITVTASDRVNNVTLVLSRGLAVTGTIVDRAGEPVQGMPVQALQVSASGAGRRAVLAGALVGGNRQTDDRGQYRVLGLQPGTYVIAALADAASLRDAPSSGGDVTAAQTVPIYFPGSASIADAVTVTIAAADVEGIDFAVSDVPTARVTGVALDSNGTPLDGTVQLAVSQRSGNIVPAARATRTTAGGAFTFFNVPPGEYVVQVVRFPPMPAQLDRSVDFGESIEFAAQYLTVGERDAEPVTLRAARGAVLEVRLVVDSTGSAESFDRVQIDVHPIGVDLTRMSSVRSTGQVGRDRRFRLTALAGPWRLVVSGMPEGWYLKSVAIDGSDMTDRIIDLGLGGAASAEAVVSPKGGTIAGRITAARAARASPSVVVFPQDRAKWFERSRFIKVVGTSQDGSFRASSLPPGEYFVAALATAAESADAMTPEALEQLLPRAVRVTVDEGDKRRVELSR